MNLEANQVENAGRLGRLDATAGGRSKLAVQRVELDANSAKTKSSAATQFGSSNGNGLMNPPHEKPQKLPAFSWDQLNLQDSNESIEADIVSDVSHWFSLISESLSVHEILGAKIEVPSIQGSRLSFVVIVADDSDLDSALHHLAEFEFELCDKYRMKVSPSFRIYQSRQVNLLDEEFVNPLYRISYDDASAKAHIHLDRKRTSRNSR